MVDSRSILPYIERANDYARVELEEDWHAQVGSGVPAQTIPVYLCPSEPHTDVRINDGLPYVHPITYGFNLGSWFIYDPRTYRVGDGAFCVSTPTRPRDFVDGLTQTLSAAEVKAYTSYVRNTDDPGPIVPDKPAHLQRFTGDFKLGPFWVNNTGHTVWTDGRVHHSGFTTVFGPNTPVNYTHDGRVYDIDLNSQQEGRSLTRPTYAAVTAEAITRGLSTVH